MGRHKSHLTVDERKLYSNKTNEETFTLNRHNALDLSRILIQNSERRGNDVSTRQKKATERFLKSDVWDIQKDNGHSRIDVLKAYFHFFDQLFFFGSLQPRVELRFGYRKAGEVVLSGRTEVLSRNERLLGMLKGKNMKQRVVLSLYLMEKEHRSRRQALIDYRGTLLHEMIHAFLQCWACDYNGCNVTGNGHGPIWQDIAYALECASRERGFLHLEIQLGRENALAMEAHKTGRWPEKTELARWNIAERDFLEMYRAVENTGGAAAAKKIIEDGGVKARKW